MYPLGFVALSFVSFTVNEVTPLKLLHACSYTLFLKGSNISKEFPISSDIFCFFSEISKYNKC